VVSKHPSKDSLSIQEGKIHLYCDETSISTVATQRYVPPDVIEKHTTSSHMFNLSRIPGTHLENLECEIYYKIIELDF
jgi:hypothetical protein